ncbi:MAG TPA: YhdH/YhfP family quinone oxidoreductase [Burkholderiales bacterium]
MAKKFRAMVVSEAEGKGYVRRIEERSTDDLPAGEVLIRVHYSSLNYKDALSATGNRGVTRRYPHTPGIDAAGVVEQSSAAEVAVGAEVICTSYDLGMNTAGGFGQYIRVPAAWVVPLPEGLTLRESMVYGTAGLTAALCLHRLQQAGIAPDQGEVVVTGATGGVGSIAVGLLARAGYRVIAATGKAQEREFLEGLGAAEVVGRDAVDDTSGKPLLPPRWAAAVDTVGGNILATLLRSLKPAGAVACCGLVASPELHTNVYPFILRNVSLLGVDSVTVPSMALRRAMWSKLATEWKLPMLERIAREVPLEDLDPEIDRILQGAQKGRVVVNLL